MRYVKLACDLVLTCMEQVCHDFSPGTLVSFRWWSSYRTACVVHNSRGANDWYEIINGDIGIIVGNEETTGDFSVDDRQITVLFTRLNKLLYVYPAMLRIHTEQP